MSLDERQIEELVDRILENNKLVDKFADKLFAKLGYKFGRRNILEAILAGAGALGFGMGVANARTLITDKYIDIDGVRYGINVVEVTANYTANYNDIVLVDASGGVVTVTLPPPKANAVINVKKIDSSSNAVTIDGGGANIDGQTSIQITTQYESYTLVSDGSNWWII